MRPRRAVRAVARHGGARPARDHRSRRLPLHPQPHVLALDGLPAQLEAAAPQPGHPRHRTGHGSRPGPGRRVERAAKRHPRFQLLLPGAPPDEHRRAQRADPPAPPPWPRHRRRRVQPRLPCHPPPRGTSPARGQLRPQTLPVHPQRAGPVRTGPCLHRDGLRQRGRDQARSRPGGPRLRRPLEGQHRIRAGSVGVRFQAHHLRRARRAVSTGHRLAHPPPASPAPSARTPCATSAETSPPF